MTVQSTTARADYTGNGATTLFPVPFYFLDATHIQVLLIDNSASPPTVTPQTLNSDYSVASVGNEQGGSITMAVAPAATQRLTILRNVPFTQLIHYVPNDPFPAATHEQAIDQLTMETQELGEELNHTLRFPTYEQTSGAIPPASQRANTALTFDANGQPSYAPLPSSLGAGDLRLDVFVANGTPPFSFVPGTTTQLTLSRAPLSKGNCWVYWDGTPQLDFTLSGTTLTFPTAIPVGISNVYVRIGTTLSVGLPAQQSVGDDELVWGPTLTHNFASIAALRANADARYSSAYVRSYYGDNANSQGRYSVDQTDLSSADNGGTIIIDAIGRRWKLDLTNDVTIEQFGARGVAIGLTPTVDATVAWQAAVNALPRVTVPTKSFLVDAGNITLPAGAEIYGESRRGAIIPTTTQAQLGTGSVVYVTGTAKSPFVYQSGNRFIGLTFYYPNQLRTLTTPIAYPYTLTHNPALTGTIFVDVLFRDVYFVNTYQGIDARIDHLDFEFNRVQGMALLCGINIDGGGGGDYLNQINFSYYYFGQSGDAFNTWCKANGQIIQIGRSDDIDMQEMFIGTGFIGLRTYVGSVNQAWGPYGTIRGLSMDVVTNGIVSEATYPSNQGVMVVHGFLCNATAVDVQFSNIAGTPSHWRFHGGTTWGARSESFLVGQSGSSLRIRGFDIQTGYVTDGVRSITAGASIDLDSVTFGGLAAAVTTVGFAQTLLKITNCDFTAGGGLNLGTATACVIKDNIGLNDKFFAVASSAGIDVTNTGDLVRLTGTTTVGSIGGGWRGRRVYFQPIDGSVTFQTGGNIIGGLVLAQNIGREYVCDGANWFPVGN